MSQAIECSFLEMRGLQNTKGVFGKLGFCGVSFSARKRASKRNGPTRNTFLDCFNFIADLQSEDRSRPGFCLKKKYMIVALITDWPAIILRLQKWWPTPLVVTCHIKAQGYSKWDPAPLHHTKNVIPVYHVKPSHESFPKNV